MWSGAREGRIRRTGTSRQKVDETTTTYLVKTYRFCARSLTMNRFRAAKPPYLYSTRFYHTRQSVKFRHQTRCLSKPESDNYVRDLPSA
jgi:hypothetical protein